MRTLALLLLLAAAMPARAQAGGNRAATAADTVRGTASFPTPRDAVAGSWSEALSTLESLAASLDAYPDTPADQQDDARNSLAVTAAMSTGGLVETSRFTDAITGAEAPREANSALFQQGYVLAYYLAGVTHEATAGTDDGSASDWHVHAATIRDMTGQIHATLATLGIDPTP